MGTNRARLVADLFFFSYKRDFIIALRTNAAPFVMSLI